MFVFYFMKIYPLSIISNSKFQISKRNNLIINHLKKSAQLFIDFLFLIVRLFIFNKEITRLLRAHLYICLSFYFFYKPNILFSATKLLLN